MRYCVAVLMLFSVLPVMNALAAPAPPPSAILDIGSPPKGETAEEYCNEEVRCLTHPRGMLNDVWCKPEIKKLTSISRLKDPRRWLSENLEVAPVPGTSQLRLRFRAGNTAEQVAILNTLLHINLQLEAERIKSREKCLRWNENCIRELEKRIESGQHPESVNSYRKGIDDLRSIHIPACRAEIDRLKQIAVIRWAK